MNNLIVLESVELKSDQYRPGQAINILLRWRSTQAVNEAYTVFVHLLGPDGRVVVGHDGEPAGGARPTTNWVPGEFVTDSHEMIVPDKLQPGEYLFEVGLYDAGAPGMPRLPVLDEAGSQSIDRTLLGPIDVR